MAKQISVATSLLKVKKFTFLWTVDNFSHWSIDKEAWLIPEDVDTGSMPQWSAKVKLHLNDGGYVYLSINLKMDICAYFKVSVVNAKKENLTLYERNWFTAGNKCFKTHDLFKAAFLLHKENRFVIQDKLTLMFAVDCIVQSIDNEVQSSAAVSLQDSPNDLRNAFTQLFDSKQFTDVTLKVGEYTVKAHKAVLIARSPVFAAMFKHDMKEHQLDCVTMMDISPEVLEAMLRYMYTDHIPNLDARAEQLLEAADKYEILKLKLECEESVLANISIENAVYTLMLADRFNAEHLKAKTLKYITSNIFGIIKTEDWKEMFKIGISAQLVEAAIRAMALQKNMEEETEG